MTRRRLREHGIRPDHDLGQNFLVDPNLLDVIGRIAALAPEDVVLEIGGGVGALSEYLAARVAHVHVVEIDPRLEAPLREALAPHPDRHTLHLGDALALALDELDPVPDKVVANLPYGIAATALLKTIDELPRVGLWVAMVQREVGERLAAAPGSGAYGLPSVLAQLSTDVEIVRAVPRTVFLPVPHVDSVLVRLRRRGPAAAPRVRAVAAAAFAHRRKALPRSLSLAPGAERDVRDRARRALEDLGHPADERAERLAPEEFRALAEALA